MCKDKENKPVKSNTQVESPTLGTIRLLWKTK